jgi:hypothetical protein
MTKNNTPEALQKIVENRLQELLRCARICGASEIKLLPGGIEITVDRVVTTPLMRAAVSLQECYPDGGVYASSLLNKLVLCVYYKMDE